MKYAQIVEVLGGDSVVTRPVTGELDLVELVRAGLTKSALFHLADAFQFTQSEIANIFNLSLRTVQRFKQQEREEELLDQAVSDRVVQLADLYAYGREVLGEAIFQKWCQTSLRTLGGKRPKDLLFTSVGIEMVKDELIRIEYGVYS